MKGVAIATRRAAESGGQNNFAVKPVTSGGGGGGIGLRLILTRRGHLVPHLFAPNAEAGNGLRWTDEIERFRDEAAFCVVKSAPYIVNCLEDILSGCERSEWVNL